MEYCTQHSAQELLSSLFYSSSGGLLPEGVIPGVLFMIHPGRKPVSVIPGMMLFVGSCLYKI
ncbi:hypothetical protein P6E23_004121 [Escherichia coli]|nr:hypothetical protein [Escherichia coli]